MRGYSAVLLERNEGRDACPAIVDRRGYRTVSWGELKRNVTKVAAYAAGAGLAGVIPVKMERTAEAVATLLGLNRAGLGVAPLAYNAPAERCALIAEQTGNALWTAEEYEKAMEGPDVEALSPAEFGPEDPALVIFTSGSTGTPKGVMIGNGAVEAAAVRFSGPRFFDCRVGENALQSSSFSFVAILIDLVAPLYSGCTVHLLPEEARKNPDAMTAYMNAHTIRTCYSAPKLLPMLGETPSLRVMLTGGERLSGFAPRGYRLYNGYGMSEMAAVALWYPVTEPSPNTPIGKPDPMFRCYLVDEDGRLADEGEICLSGPIASGYFKMPELTAEVFTKNPFSDEPGHEVLIRSGDIGRRLPSGDLVFVNRKDFMIKINGQRVEPGETEAVLKQVCRLPDAAVVGFTEEDGRTYLAAYYVSENELDPDEVRAKLARHLPSYSIPSFFLRLDAWPLNGNGKLDRSALPRPKTSAGQSEYAAPAGETEALLCRAFEEVLGISRIGAADRFLLCGGDSIRAMRVCRLVPAAGLSADLILTHQSPREIAKHLPETPAEPVETAPSRLPASLLTDSQMGVYLDCILHPDGVMYNIPMHFTFPRTPGMTAGTVASAVDGVITRHGALYACLRAHEDEIRMCRLPFPEGGICRAEEADSFDGEAEEQAFVRPFSLFEGPLCRARAVLTPDSVELLLDCHHIVGDGTSVALLARQIADALAGRPVEDETVDAFAAAEEVRSAAEGDSGEAKAYFDGLLAGCETDSNLLFDHRPEDGADCRRAYGERTVSVPGLEAFLSRHGLTESSFFMGAFGYVLAKMTGQNEALFAVAESGRKTVRWDRTVSMFVRTLPVLLKLDETVAASDLLRACQAQFYASVGNDRCSFGELAREYGVTSDVMFVYQSDLMGDFDGPAGRVGVKTVPVSEGFTNLALSVSRRGGEYELSLGYRTACYEARTAERFLSLLESVVSAFAADTVLRDIPLLGDGDEAILDGWNETDSPYESDKTVLDLFARAAARNPGKTALVCRERRYTYAEADDLSTRLALWLRRCGITDGDTVSVLIPRCEYMLLASLGALKAGAVYQPLDPTYPAERLSFMCRDASSKVLLADRSLLSLLPDYEGKILTTDEIPSLPKGMIDWPLPTPDSLFVLLYTSGTTGLPKGCKLTHRNVAAYVHAYHTLFAVGEDTVSAAYASYGFDAHLSEIYPAVTAGGELHIVTDDIRLDLPALKRYFEDNGVTHTVMTTQIARQFVSEYPAVKHLRSILAGGEKLATVTPPETYRLTNGYGPSEATVMVSSFTLDGLYADTPIGKALPNAKLYVIDPYGRRLPIGVPGELMAAGPQVAAGYLNRPDKTEAVFVKNPFAADPDGVFGRGYLTGDIVRFTESGNLEIIGRRDMQVKIRGFRIELSEVETVIRAYPGVSDAVVVAVDDPSGGKCLHAYVVADKPVDTDDLCRFIARQKPPYMVPAATAQIERIPLTPNLKVDKRKLPPITAMPRRTSDGGCRKLTDLETALSAIVREIVGHEDFSVETEFVAAGITSISSIKLAVQIYKHFGLHITSKEILDGGTILSVENGIVSSFLRKPEPAEAAEAADGAPADCPLTQVQVGIYTDSLRRGMKTYDIPCLVKLAPGTDGERLKAAVRTAVAAHPSLLCRIKAGEDGEARVYPAPDMTVTVEEESADSLAVGLTEFAFDDSPLFRFRLLHVGGEDYLYAEIHHIVADGESLSVLLGDVAAAYRGEAVEKEPYTAYTLARDEEAARRSEEMDAAKAYYDSVFRGVSTDYLPAADRCGEDSAGVADETDLPAREELCALCRRYGVSENVLFHGAFAITLARFSAHEDALFATLHNGRGDPRTEHLVAMLAKTLPFYVPVADKTPVGELLCAVDERLNKLKKYDLYSFADASREYGVAAEPLLIYQGELMESTPLGQIVTPDLSGEDVKPKSALSVEVKCEGGAYRLHAEYNAGRYSAAWAEGFLDAFATVIRALSDAETVGDVNVCSAKALASFGDFNDTAWPVPYRPAYRLIEEQALKHPDRTAVVAAGERLTYARLDRLADELAGKLCALGLAPGSTVAVLVGRTKEIYVAQYGILKAAGAFLCLSAEYPDERIRFIAEDSAAAAIVTTRKLAEERAELLRELDVPVICADELTGRLTYERPQAEIPPDSLAYYIYTSGSTGKPKGVMVKQRGLVNVAAFTPKNHEFDGYAEEGAVSTAVSAFTFDASVVEGFVALAGGSTVCVASDDEIHDPTAFCRLCRDCGVTCLFGTPSFLTNLTDCADFAAVAKGLHYVLAGGEEFTEGLLGKLVGMNPKLNVINGYGPSEATITCSAKYLTPGRPITVGAPLTNTELYCVDRQNRILPMGALGELTILGDGVGKGYLNRPELTEKAFVTLRGKPAFKTGDLAVISHDGEVYFKGRIDNQVKIRGFRVELGEVEHAVSRVPGVKSVAVVVRGDGENRHLAAYYTAERPVSPEEVTATVSRTLARYMVPRVLCQLDAMPMTANGKIDRKALPEVREVSRKAGRVPATETEKQIAAVFADVLKAETVYGDDNFFEIGGNSLAASRAVMLLKSKGFAVEYQTIFDCQTPRALAEYLGDGGTAAAGGTMSFDELGDPTDPSLRDLLQYNTPEYAGLVQREPLGDVLLTGAVGFLGSHVLRELLRRETGHVYCLVRKGRFESAVRRLDAISFYYFGECFSETYPGRLTVVNGDLTGDNLGRLFRDVALETVINCAASVKHYASDDSIEFVNVHGVENLIALAKGKNARLIQISTTSVAGVHTDATKARGLKLREDRLFCGDDMGNRYLISKHKAELCMLEAIRGGLRGKIIRVGNLMGRYSDGEFQMNMGTNAFLGALKGFSVMGMSPISHSTDPMEFSPIDCTAEAIVTLAGTGDRFTVFHANCRYGFDEMMLINACNRCGISIVPTEDKIYYEAYNRRLGDPSVNKYLGALVTNDRPDLTMIEVDNGFTANVLYRLGFAWPFIDDGYLRRVIQQLKSIGFFDMR